jgi:4-hydroxybenzoyl-CoA reductase beta subunit
MKQKLLRPERLIDIKQIPEMASIRQLPDGQISLGALTTLSAIERSDLIRERVPSLAEAAASVATPQIRNKATLGGNICLNTRCWYYNIPAFSRKTRAVCQKQGGSVCHVVPGEKQGRCYSLFSADTVPALMSLDSRVKLSSADGSRVVPLPELYSGDGIKPLTLRRDELITEVLIPSPLARAHSCYVKFRERGTLDFPILGVAATVVFADDNVTCRGARIALTGVSSAPYAASNAEAYLENKPLTPQTITAAADLAREQIIVYSMNGVPARYKRAMIAEYVARALTQVQQSSAGRDGQL